MDPSKIDLNTVPKKFCDNAFVAATQETFVIGLYSGAEGAFYALSPQHMKRLQQNLTHHVTEYEKSFGTINTQWPQLLQSPIQSKDLGEDTDEKSK